MKVLFMIPRNDPPVLDGAFSPKFKDFVAQCLRKAPSERPTAAELLEHPFIRSAKHVSHLLDLIERSQNASLDRDDDLASSSSSVRMNGDYDAFARSCETISSSSHAAAPSSLGATESSAHDHATGNGASEEFDRFARSKVHTRAKSTSVDSGWDFNTIRISSTSAAANGGGGGAISSGALFAPTLATVQPLCESTGELSGDGTRLSESPAPASAAAMGHSGSANQFEEDDDDDGGVDEDMEAFETIVKPAVFGVLSGEMDAEELVHDDAIKVREELLLDFLQAFECLTVEKGLLSKVLDSLLVHGSQQS